MLIHETALHDLSQHLTRASMILTYCSPVDLWKEGRYHEHLKQGEVEEEEGLERLRIEDLFALAIPVAMMVVAFGGW